jgi:putative peptidoglycan lipid II flippase
MVRDMATAALFGLAAGGVMDAFVVAFRIPNLFRRLFGEGALSASYLPVLSARLEEDRRSAWQLASVIFTWLTVVLLGLFLAAEAVCLLIYVFWGNVPGVSLLIGLTAALLPYMVLICLTAQAAATLQALGHFTMPALAPVVLNVCWLLGVWVAASFFTDDKHAQAYVLAVSVLLGGVVQLGMQLPPLLRHGFRFDYDWAASASAVGQVVRAVLPMMFGLAVTQVNTLLDVLIAWGLAAAPDGPQTILWLSGTVDYPMRQGAAASVYYGERMYQFPVGLLGVTVATVIFPLLSRHAARGMRERIGQDLTLGLRLVWLLALPASVGLVLLSGPIARLLFDHGQFTSDDARRTAHMIAAYGLGVWAYCALPVMVRGYYALGLRTTPVKIAAATVALNLLLNLTLIWPLAEVGLAVSTALSAVVQVVVLVVVFSRRGSPLAWRDLASTALAALVAATLMGLACWITLRQLPPADGLVGRLLGVLVPLVIGSMVYFAFLRFLWPRELALLLGRIGEEKP